MLFTYKPPFIAIYITALITFCIAMKTKKRRFVWLTLFLWLCFSGYVKIDKICWIFGMQSISFFDNYMGMTAMGWQLLRFTSCALDYIEALKCENDTKVKRQFALINIIGFNFYLPVFSQGPPILFSSYLDMIKENQSAQNDDIWERLEKLLYELSELVATSIIAVFLMHFLYTDAIMYDPNVSDKTFKCNDSDIR